MLVCIRHAKPSSQDQINKTKEAQETPQESQRPDSAKVKKEEKNSLFYRDAWLPEARSDVR